MSLFIDLYAELPYPELLEKIEQGIGRFRFIPTVSTDLGPRFFWGRGDVSVTGLTEEKKDIVREDSGIRNPVSRLHFHPNPDYEGSLDILQMMAIALKEWQGDLVLISYDETVLVERVNDEIRFSKNMNDEKRSLFGDVAR